MAEADPLAVLRVLERHRVRYVLIGAAAARVAGAPVVTEDIDVTPAPDKTNLERLGGALRELGARVRSASDPEGVPFPVDPAMLGGGNLWTLTTEVGDLDICFVPSGTRGYDDLRQEASVERVAKSLKVAVASLRDVIRSKEAAGRPKDIAQLPLLRQTLEEIRRREQVGRLQTCRSAKEQVEHSLVYAYRDRKAPKRTMRSLWIIRINAAARQHGLSYNQFVAGCRKAEIELDRKVLSDLAVSDPPALGAIAERVRAALQA